MGDHVVAILIGRIPESLFSLVSQAILFDVSMHHPLQDSLFCLSAATAGVAASCAGPWRG